MENSDSEQPKKRRRKKPAPKRKPSIAVNLRIPADVWEKLEWEAVKDGLARPDVIRRELSRATAHSRPPQNDDTAVIQGFTGRRRDAWLALAEAIGKPVGEIAAEVMDTMVRRHFGTAPILRNGRWHWDGPDKGKTA